MIPEREKVICARLRRFRETLQIPRTKFALTLGISSDRLSSYELGRAQVRYELFAAVQKHYPINPVWLATGEELPRLEGFTDEKFREQVKPRELFSRVYDRLLERYLTMDRMNQEGCEFNLRLLENWSDPKTLARLKKARLEAGVPLEALAETFSAALRANFTAKDLAMFESGKKIPNIRTIAAWKDELRLNESWLWKGSGEMFENPFWRTPEYQSALKSARLAAGLSFEDVAARLRVHTTARVTAREMELVECGKMITTGSLMLGLPRVLGIPGEQLFPASRAPANAPTRSQKLALIKQNFEKMRSAFDSLAEQFRELEEKVLALDPPPS